MFTVDGITWSIPCDITRQPDVTMSDISGMMLNGVIYNDPIGSYLSYEVTLTPDPHSMGEYYQLYDVLTNPVPSHTFMLPYDDDMIEVEASVSGMRDVYIYMGANRAPYWKGLRFTVTANTPYKEETLDGVISRGLPALPPTAEAEIGDSYQWTADGWLEISGLPNAELMSFPRS
jgi:hypothetical protein